MCIGFLIIDNADGAGTRWYPCLSNSSPQSSSPLEPKSHAESARDILPQNNCKATCWFCLSQLRP